VWNNNSDQTWGWRQGPVIPKNEWAMIAITIDKDKAVSYVYTDKNKLQSNVNKIPHEKQTIADNLKIGRDECCGDNRHVMGIIDEVMIFNRALSENEILKLAKEGLAVEYSGKLAGKWGYIKQL